MGALRLPLSAVSPPSTLLRGQFFHTAPRILTVSFKRNTLYKLLAHLGHEAEFGLGEDVDELNHPPLALSLHPVEADPLQGGHLAVGRTGSRQGGGLTDS